jgi:hypothetical protein
MSIYLKEIREALKHSKDFKYIVAFTNSKGYNDCFGCEDFDELYDCISNFFYFINNGNSFISIFHDNKLYRIYDVSKDKILKAVDYNNIHGLHV